MLARRSRRRAIMIRTTVVLGARSRRSGRRPLGAPFDPALPMGRHRRVRPECAIPRASRAADDLGHARTGRTGEGPRTRPPTRLADMDGLRPSARVDRYCGRNAGYPVRPLLQRLERAEPGTVPRADSSTAGPLRRAVAQPRGSTGAVYGGMKAGSPRAVVAAARRRRAAATGLRRAGSRTRWLRRRSRGCSRLHGHAWCSRPTSTIRTRSSAPARCRRPGTRTSISHSCRSSRGTSRSGSRRASTSGSRSTGSRRGPASPVA